MDRSIQEINCRQVSGLGALFDTEPTVTWLIKGGTAPAARPLLFPEKASQDIISRHIRSRPFGALGIATLPNVIVSNRSIVGTEQSVALLGNLVEPYVDQYLRDGLYVGGTALGSRTPVDVSGAVALVTHWNSYVFGHWLLEGLPRVLLLKQFMPFLPPFSVAVPTYLYPAIADYIKLLLPNVPIIFYKDHAEYLRCEHLIVPRASFFHPAIIDLIDDIVPPKESKRHLYISRVKQSAFREMENRQEIESIAETSGLEIICPETLPITEQIALFANADLIVGEFGSSLHNALFSPEGTTIFSLNWIVNVQSRISQIRGHQLGYLLPEAGYVGFTPGAEKKFYSINPESFRSCLALCQDVSQRRKPRLP